MTSTILLLLSLLLACLFGSGNQAWSWGPALLALAAALVVSAFERPPVKSAGRPRWSILMAVLLSAVYLAVRAWFSPVWEFALADLLIIGAVFGACLLGMHIARSGRWLSVLFGGLSAIVLLNFAVALLQVTDPEFSVLGLPRLTKFPTGLFTQYSYFANFMIGCGCLLAAVALLRRDPALLRTLWGLASAAAFASVCLSRSRGSLVGLACGGAILLVLLLPAIKRRSKKAFGTVVVLLPLLMIGGGLWTGKMLMATQKVRGHSATVEDLADNTKRLHFLGAALETAGEHPWLGGGSQSFRWECRHHWDVKAWGMMGGDPDYVHNEFMQALTDYGIVGGALLLVALVALLINGFAAVFLPGEKGREASSRQALLAGALAGLMGMLCQASFSFVVHTLPSALLIGLLAGLVAGSCGRPGRMTGKTHPLAARLLAAAVGLALVFPAWGGAKALVVALRRTEEVEAQLREATTRWPSAEFPMALGHFLYSRSQQAGCAEARRELGERAVAAYATALQRNPFEPEAAVNRARLLSMLGSAEESEREFRRAIELQGAFEAGYQAHYHYADHLYRRGEALYQQSKLQQAKEFAAEARTQLAESGELASPGYFRSWRILRYSVARLDHLLAGYFAYKDGHDLWMQRKPEEALGQFQQAEKFLAKVRTPKGRRPAKDSEEARLLAEVRRMIKFLEGAGIRPAGEPGAE